MDGVGPVLALVGLVVIWAAWVLAFRIKTTCGAMTSKGHPCRVNVRGILSACHHIEHKRQKRRALWRMVRGTLYPGDRLAKLTPLAPAPQFRRQLQAPDVPSVDPDGLRIARLSLVLTLIGTLATVVGTIAAFRG